MNLLYIPAPGDKLRVMQDWEINADYWRSSWELRQALDIKAPGTGFKFSIPAGTVFRIESYNKIKAQNYTENRVTLRTISSPDSRISGAKFGGRGSVRFAPTLEDMNNLIYEKVT